MPPPQDTRSKVHTKFVRDLWQECLDDCAGDESQAKMLFEKITDSVARQELQRQTRVRKRARRESTENVALASARDGQDNVESDDASSSSSESDSSSASEDANNESQQESEPGLADSNARRRAPKKRLQWLKPGVLSQHIGVGQSVLRNWANAGVVRTMLSPGGHRLYSLKSVKQQMQSAAVRKQQKQQQVEEEPTSLKHGERQIVVYARLDGNKLTDAQLETASSAIRAKVEAHYQHSCFESELQSCLIIVELEPDENAKRSKQFGHDFADTPGSRRLLQTICKRDCNEPSRSKRSMVVLQAADDISSAPSTYSFFVLLCRNMGATIDVVPGLFDHWKSSGV